MKRQYLGDAKDAFKWDYLDFLTRELGLSVLNVVLMMTPDDDSSHGRTDPAGFYKGHQSIDSRGEGVVRFCKDLREEQTRQGDMAFSLLNTLPEYTGAKYTVKQHKGLECFASFDVEGARRDYFSDFSADQPQIVFLDPDTGFSPSRPTESHVTHSEVRHMQGNTHDDSVVVVFQDLSRKKPEAYFRDIAGQYDPCQAAAVRWGGRVMLFAFGNSAQIDRVRDINNRYCKNRSVVTLN